MKFPKYSCSACGKPATRKWNLARHIDICHAGIGNCVSNWGFSVGGYDQDWIKPEKAAIHRGNDHYVRSKLLKQFLFSRNESTDRKPEPDYQHVFKEELLRELARKAASLNSSIIQPAQAAMSPPFFPKISLAPTQTKYYLDPTSYLQIFGFRASVCPKCLVSETHYVACADVEGDGRVEEAHVCDPTKVAIAGELVNRFGLLRVLQSDLPRLIKQKVDLWTGKNSHLVAIKLPSTREEIIKLQNPANPANPGIIFQYSKQRHVKLQLTIENKNRANYLIRAINQRKILLRDYELTDFLGNIRDATFGILTVCHNNIYKNLSENQGEVQQESHTSYFLYIR
jgi:hypothetical protein